MNFVGVVAEDNRLNKYLNINMGGENLSISHSKIARVGPYLYLGYKVSPEKGALKVEYQVKTLTIQKTCEDLHKDFDSIFQKLSSGKHYKEYSAPRDCMSGSIKKSETKLYKDKPSCTHMPFFTETVDPGPNVDSYKVTGVVLLSTNYTEYQHRQNTHLIHFSSSGIYPQYSELE